MEKIISVKLFAIVICLFVFFTAIILIYKNLNENIVINIYYTGNNGNARKFAEEMEASGLVEAIRNEDGNLRYEYFYPKNDGETILLIDIWKNQKALDLHHKTPMMEKIAELRNKYDLHMKVERYNLEGKNNLKSDEKFIRR